MPAIRGLAVLALANDQVALTVSATQQRSPCLGANVVTRAFARGVYNATALPSADALPAWKDRFG